MIITLECYRSRLYYYPANWIFSSVNGIKGNTDGANRENSGRSVYNFCLRDYLGNQRYDEAGEVGHQTNMEAETLIVLKYLRYWKDNQVQPMVIDTDSFVCRRL